MAQIPQLKRLLIEDFATQAEWISKLILPLNEFMQNVINALNKDLSLTDNLRAQLRVLRVAGASVITGDTYAGYPVIFRPSSLTGLNSRASVVGDGIQPGTEISAVFSNEFIDVANTTAVGTINITGIANTTTYAVGQPISGPGIPINAIIISIVSATAINLDQVLIGGGSATANIKLERGILMSATASSTQLGETIRLGGEFPIILKHSLTTRPSIVFVGAIAENSASPELILKSNSVDWTTGAGEISINNITGLSNGREYTIIFVLIGN